MRLRAFNTTTCVLCIFCTYLFQLSAQETTLHDPAFNALVQRNWNNHTVAELLTAIDSSSGKQWKFYGWQDNRNHGYSGYELRFVFDYSDTEDIYIHLHVQEDDSLHTRIRFWNIGAIHRTIIMGLYAGTAPRMAQAAANDFQCLALALYNLNTNNDPMQCYKGPIELPPDPQAIDPAVMEIIRQSCDKPRRAEDRQKR